MTLCLTEGCVPSLQMFTLRVVSYVNKEMFHSAN